MKRLYDKYKNDPDLVFLTVSINVFIAGEEMRSFLKANNIQFTVLLDLEGQTTTTYSALIPFSYFIDRQGVVRHRVAGEGTLAAFERGLAIILAK